MPDFFYIFLTLLLEIVLWSKLLYGNLSRYAGIHYHWKLSTDEITNSHAELYFHLKKLDQIKINLPLCKYIKENNTSHIAFQRQFIDNHKTSIY